MDELLKEDLDNLKHMLGMNYSKKCWGYRNYYVSNIDDDSMQKLLRMGYIRKGGQSELYYYYHATEQGCIVAGLSKRQTKKALGLIK